MLWILLGIIISYLAGSIPTAYIFGRIIKKTDIRKFGSGNVGATNAFRLLGRGWGAAVLALDILKGFLPVVILPSLIGAGVTIPLEAFCIILGLSCICGHNWTIFLNFKGGKGVATTLGVLLGLSIKIAGLKIILGITILIWLVVFILSRTISLASVLAALSFPLLTVLSGQSIGLILIVTLLAVFIIFRHKPNIKRILKGKEPKLNFKK
ncbi:MAG: glycerol-3-phosphate 1-O-acyltransferase PlsY [Candidatus Omnitrophica bacterium]|nr:glycerol-3-phosphate 1-O-acyltransferase PlsY [Candidatus Omnitrophota bacterium]MDD5027269.1 glycerol-3-phosphate 1-O-acyltransferase PlsY [Candidatus Omnitrophota bacterium]MDD5661854.1 glycerol-3-phosphate 1-O-acyltransferase PlsY [Candidatus Omnitrophota bacterium]